MSQINFRNAQFLTSAAKIDQCPPDVGFEVAFAGRSNAGKSSAINTLTDNGKLARTSKTPGRTQLINFFELDDERRIVDLPGYGYAKVPIAVKDHWQKHLGAYLESRQCLRGLVLMVDIRHPLKEFDRTMIEWARKGQLPIHILLTKADKLKKGPAKASLLAVQKEVASMGHLATVQTFSALKRAGVDVLRNRLNELMNEPVVDQTIDQPDQED